MKVFITYLHLFFLIFITMSTGKIIVEEHISPQDLKVLLNAERRGMTRFRSNAFEQLAEVVCIGNDVLQAFLPSIFGSTDVEVKYYVYYKKHIPDMVIPSEEYLFKKVFSKSELRKQQFTLNFNPEKKVALIVHGFMSHGNATWVLEMVSSLRNWGNLNIIVVDWSNAGSSMQYWMAVKQISMVGDSINKFFQWLWNQYRTKPPYIHCIGHSLGSHICGDASYKYRFFNRITGLDPALPCFKDVGKNYRLDEHDAEYVDVIHTNAPRQVRLSVRLGLPMPLGSSDFFPNGGDCQPGCRYLQKRSNSSEGLGLEEAICSHGRSYEYFTDSIKHGKTMECTFMAHEWDNKKPIPQRIKECHEKTCPQMGINAIGRGKVPRAEGTYYVITRDQKPYCLSRVPLLPYPLLKYTGL